MEIHTRAPVEQLRLCQNDYMWQGGLRVGASVTEQCALDRQPWVSRRLVRFSFFFFWWVHSCQQCGCCCLIFFYYFIILILFIFIF